MDDYLDLESPGEEMQDIRPSAQVEVTTQADDTEGAETIETREAPMEDVRLPVAPVHKPATEMALADTPASEVPPTAEAAVIEHVETTEPVSIETSHGETVESEVNITTSVSQVGIMVL